MTVLSGVAAERPTVRGVVPATIAGALEAMSRALAVALAPIRVNVVSPGFIGAHDGTHAQGNAQRAEGVESARERLPVDRLGKPSEVAQAIASAIDNHFMIGNVLHVDGGGRLT